jgi:hypothetical protein
MAKRRTDEEIIADLEIRIARIKAREARRKAATDPALRHIRVALRAIDKALAETRDPSTRRALGEASGALATCLGIRRPATKAARMARVRQPDAWVRFEEDAVLRYERENPGRAPEEIAAALGMGTGAVCSVLERVVGKDKTQVDGHGDAPRNIASEQ